MTIVMDHLKRRPWATAAAVCAWGVTVALTVLLVPGTLVLAGPPALVATAPLAAPPAHQPTATLTAAGALALWSIVGITLLGSYFLPSAILLGIDYLRTRTNPPATRPPRLHQQR